MASCLPMKDREGTPYMIELTRLNGSRLAINCDLIKYAEAAPDTVLTLITGEKLVVLEPCSEVSQRTLDYRAGRLRCRRARTQPHPQRLRRIINFTLEEDSHGYRQHRWNRARHPRHSRRHD